MATYTVSQIPGINDTLAHFLAWAQFFGGGFTTCGWVAQTGHGEVVATGTGASYAWTTPKLPTTVLQPTSQYRFNGAWVSGNTYVGGNTIGTTLTDLVTFGGVTYVHITATSALTTSPDLDPTNWQPYQYEIWKSNGSNTSSLPIYVRIAYSTAAAASGGPAIHLSIGTGVDANGNITTGANMGSGSPTTVGWVRVGSSGQSILGNMLFSGDADNFRFCTWQAMAATPYQWVVCVDRSKNASGTDTNAFVQILFNYPLSGTVQGGGSVLLNSSIGVTPISQYNGGLTTQQLPGLVCTANNGTSVINFGSTIPLPIFPLVGFLANPVKGLVGFIQADVVDGMIVPVWIYGASHSYIVIKTNANSASGPLIGGLAGYICPALLWE